jgi:TonB family protein
MRTLQLTLDSWVLAYLLNSLWQVPLVCVAALAAARLARPAGPRLEHRVWVGALMLEAVLPLCHLDLNELWGRAWGLMLWFRAGGAAGGLTRITFGGVMARGAAMPWLPAEALTAIAAAYVLGLVYFAGRLGWGVLTTDSIRRRASGLQLPRESAQAMSRLEGQLGLGRGAVRIATSNEIHGPAAVGVLQQTLLLPKGFLDKLCADDLDALLAHELAHMRRADFAKNLIYGLVSLPVAYHPLLSLTRARLAETREMVCDDLAAEAAGGRESYARSLLRLASMLSDRTTPRILHAIGILDANIFERRVMNLTRRTIEVKGARRLAVIAGCGLIALATCTSALALRMGVTEPATQYPPPSRVHVKSDSLTAVSKVPPVYPMDAKKARVTGKVVLSAIIGKDGTVEHLSVDSGPSQLQQAAIDAVRQWTFQPYLLNGDPIEVETTINITFSLAN